MMKNVVQLLWKSNNNEECDTAVMEIKFETDKPQRQATYLLTYAPNKDLNQSVRPQV